MGRYKTNEERDRKVMANKARKKAIKQAMRQVIEEQAPVLEKLKDEETK